MLKSYAFRRPYMTPASGLVNANSVKQAHKVITNAYGVCPDQLIYCVENDKWYKKDENGR